MSEQEKWEEEAQIKAEEFYIDQNYIITFKVGYLQACKVRQEEIERLREGIKMALICGMPEGIALVEEAK